MKLIIRLSVIIFVLYGAIIFGIITFIHDGSFEAYGPNVIEALALFPGVFMFWCIAAFVAVGSVGSIIYLLMWAFNINDN